MTSRAVGYDKRSVRSSGQMQSVWWENPCTSPCCPRELQSHWPVSGLTLLANGAATSAPVSAPNKILIGGTSGEFTQMTRGHKIGLLSGSEYDRQQMRSREPHFLIYTKYYMCCVRLISFISLWSFITYGDQVSCRNTSSQDDTAVKANISIFCNHSRLSV